MCRISCSRVLCGFHALFSKIIVSLTQGAFHCTVTVLIPLKSKFLNHFLFALPVMLVPFSLNTETKSYYALYEQNNLKQFPTVYAILLNKQRAHCVQPPEGAIKTCKFAVCKYLKCSNRFLYLSMLCMFL